MTRWSRAVEEQIESAREEPVKPGPEKNEAD